MGRKDSGGKFIDFAELPPAKGKVRGTPNSLDGSIIVVQAADLTESRKLISDFATWVRYFSIHMEVVCSKRPKRNKNMLAYLSLNFRQEAAESGCTD